MWNMQIKCVSFKDTNDTIHYETIQSKSFHQKQKMVGNYYLKKGLGFQQHLLFNSSSIVCLDVQHSNVGREKKMAATLLPSFTLSAWPSLAFSLVTTNLGFHFRTSLRTTREKMGGKKKEEKRERVVRVRQTELKRPDIRKSMCRRI